MKKAAFLQCLACLLHGQRLMAINQRGRKGHICISMRGMVGEVLESKWLDGYPEISLKSSKVISFLKPSLDLFSSFLPFSGSLCVVFNVWVFFLFDRRNKVTVFCFVEFGNGAGGEGALGSM